MSGEFEKICAQVAGMGKNEVKNRLLHFRGKLKMDFSESYLEGLTVDKLRHILLAALAVETRRRGA